jgi:hypothetical protein
MGGRREKSRYASRVSAADRAGVALVYSTGTASGQKMNPNALTAGHRTLPFGIPIWGCDHYKTTLNALKFKQAYKKRTDLVKDAMSTVPAGDRAAMVNVIMDAIKKGGLFARADGGARQHHNDDGHPVLKFKTQKGETFNQKVHRAHRRCANDNSEWWSGGGLP